MLILFLACSFAPSSPAPEESTEASGAATMAAPPPPFTADEIRAAMPVGTRLLFKIDTTEGIRYQRWEIVASTPTTASIRFTATDEKGEGTGGNVNVFTWEELERNAHFPDGTTRARRIHTWAGDQLKGWRYLVPGDEHPAGFDFADRLPGPPMRSPGMELLSDSRL